MDRQKKPLHHETGREYRGGTGKLASLPWVATEILEGYFSRRVVPLENCGV